MRGGRVEAISGSWPVMIVWVWWRVWLQRQRTGSRSVIRETTL